MCYSCLHFIICCCDWPIIFRFDLLLNQSEFPDTAFNWNPIKLTIQCFLISYPIRRLIIKSWLKIQNVTKTVRFVQKIFTPQPQNSWNIWKLMSTAKIWSMQQAKYTISRSSLIAYFVTKSLPKILIWGHIRKNIRIVNYAGKVSLNKHFMTNI